MKEQVKPLHDRRGYLKQGWWVFGFFCVLTGSIGDFVALGLAPQSIVAPVGSATLIWNLGFAKWGLGEEITKRDLLGVIMIMAGCIISVTTGSHCTPEIDFQTLLKYLAVPAFIVYATISGILMVALYVLLRCFIQPKRDRLEQYLDAAEEQVREAHEREKEKIAEKGQETDLSQIEEEADPESAKCEEKKMEEQGSVIENDSDAVLRVEAAEEIERPNSTDSKGSHDRQIISERPQPPRSRSSSPHIQDRSSPQHSPKQWAPERPRSPSHQSQSIRSIRSDSQPVVRDEEYRKQMLSGSGFTIDAALKQNILDAEAAYLPLEKYHPFLFCVISGLFGSFSMLFAKGVAELGGLSFAGKNQFIYPWIYIFFVLMLYFIISQLHFLAMGLKYFDAMYIVPVFQCCMIILSVLAGMMFYQEYRDFGVLNWILFPLGVIVTTGGVIILSFRKMGVDVDKFHDDVPDRSPNEIEMVSSGSEHGGTSDENSVSSRHGSKRTVTPDHEPRAPTPLEHVLLEPVRTPPRKRSPEDDLSSTPRATPTMGRRWSNTMKRRFQMRPESTGRHTPIGQVGDRFDSTRIRSTSRSRGTNTASAPPDFMHQPAPTFGEILAHSAVPLPSTFAGYTEIPLDILSAVTEIPIRFAENALMRRIDKAVTDNESPAEVRKLEENLQTVRSSINNSGVMHHGRTHSSQNAPELCPQLRARTVSAPAGLPTLHPRDTSGSSGVNSQTTGGTYTTQQRVADLAQAERELAKLSPPSPVPTVLAASVPTSIVAPNFTELDPQTVESPTADSAGSNDIPRGRSDSRQEQLDAMDEAAARIMDEEWEQPGEPTSEGSYYAQNSPSRSVSRRTME